MGFPLIGETIQFVIPNKSIDIPPFIKKRMKQYGPLFKTSLVGRQVVISSDPEFNYFIFQQEGKLVELWHLDSFAKLLNQDSTSITSTGYIHKHLRNVILNHFGTEILKEKLMTKLEHMISGRLQAWSRLPNMEVKSATSAMVFDFTAKQLFSYEPKKYPGENLGETFCNFIQGLMSVPLNIPGTTFHKCLKNQKRGIKLIRDLMKERRASPENCKRDFLDQIMKDMKTEKFLTDDFVVSMMFGLLLASFETISATLTLAIKLLTDNPAVVQELKEEHEAILASRENADSGLSWMEYKSLTFTHNVISETLRLASVAPGILRRAIKDIEINGYTIPKGWTIMVVPAAIQLNPDTYEDPLAFNPWRWKDMGANVTAKNFIAFGGGARSCPGGEFSKVLMAVFLHIFVTKYKWTKLKGGEVVRTPALGFGNGFHIQVSEKEG
ncbi:hypothetical protein L1049_026692 [Liquidambar formosana]|uniref:Cytochrome P450 n=1 Tax=Liquidambar formosana TaxID=63359 RepID=A0AAP0NE62_LIQFO